MAQECTQRCLQRELERIGFPPDGSQALTEMFLNRAVVVRLSPGRRIVDVNLEPIRILNKSLLA